MRNIVVVMLVVLVLAVGGITTFYSFLFSTKVHGELLSIEKVGGANNLVSSDKSIAFSYAVAIKDESGKIYTASTEDRQWAALEKLAASHYCVDARLYPYAPWNMLKAGTFHDARLLGVTEGCGKK